MWKYILIKVMIFHSYRLIKKLLEDKHFKLLMEACHVIGLTAIAKMCSICYCCYFAFMVPYFFLALDTCKSDFFPVIKI